MERVAFVATAGPRIGRGWSEAITLEVASALERVAFIATAGPRIGRG